MGERGVGSILVVEDEGIVALDLRHMLASRGYATVRTCGTCEEAREILKKNKHVAVLMDISIHGDRDGIDCAEDISRHFDIPVVFATGHTDHGTVQRALATDPFGYLVKPLSADEVHLSLQTAINRHLLEYRLRKSEERFRAIFDNSPIPIAIYDEAACLVDANVASLRVFGVGGIEDIRGYCMYNDPFLTEEQKKLIRDRAALEFVTEVDFSRYTGKADIHTRNHGVTKLGVTITPITERYNYQSLGYLVQIVEVS